MAERFVYETRNIAPFVTPVKVHFAWNSGFARAQKRRNIQSLHDAYAKSHPNSKVLEVSSQSEDELGVALSAFNLTLPLDDREVPVECAFQAGKVFEQGGPYADLLEVTPREAKRDARLRESGRIVRFSLQGQDFPTNPKDAYYRWLYFRGLMANPELAEQLLAYDAFTDIEFNPVRQVNCQAIAAAAYISVVRAGKLEAAMRDLRSFLWTVYRYVL